MCVTRSRCCFFFCRCYKMIAQVSPFSHSRCRCRGLPLWFLVSLIIVLVAVRRRCCCCFGADSHFASYFTGQAPLERCRSSNTQIRKFPDPAGHCPGHHNPEHTKLESRVMPTTALSFRCYTIDQPSQQHPTTAAPAIDNEQHQSTIAQQHNNISSSNSSTVNTPSFSNSTNNSSTRYQQPQQTATTANNGNTTNKSDMYLQASGSAG